VQNNTLMALRLTPPDIYAALPMNRFSIFDFDKAEEIIGYGRDEMNRRLDDYET
jgi:NTE family protein